LNDLFRAAPRRWMQRVLMEYELAYIGRAIESQKIRPLLLDLTTNGQAHAWRTAIMPKAHYMLKCAPPDLEVALGLLGAAPKPWGQRCQVQGKRLGTWQRADRSLTNLRCKLVRRLAHRRPYLSGVRASSNPGAVQGIMR
jgi:hypothetical protein